MGYEEGDVGTLWSQLIHRKVTKLVGPHEIGEIDKVVLGLPCLCLVISGVNCIGDTLSHANPASFEKILMDEQPLLHVANATQNKGDSEGDLEQICTTMPSWRTERTGKEMHHLEKTLTPLALEKDGTGGTIKICPASTTRPGRAWVAGIWRRDQDQKIDPMMPRMESGAEQSL